MPLRCAVSLLAAVTLLLTVAPPFPVRADTPTPTPVRMDPQTLVGKSGFFRVGKSVTGKWWFVDPDGKPFFFRGVTSVSQDGWQTRRPDGSSYDQLVAKKYGAAFAKASIDRLRGWGFNALGGFSGQEMWDQGMPYTILLNFAKDEKSPKINGTFLPDVFDPAWTRRMNEIAATVCAPRKNSRLLVGYFTDNELGWAQARSEERPLVFDPSESTLRDAGRPSLLQLCLSLPDDRPASRAAWEFVLARHQGDIARVAGDWGVPTLDSKARLPEWTAAKKAILSPGYLADDEAFSKVFAERYFRLTTEAIRREDTHHLILGCRFGAPPGPAVLAAVQSRWVDVVSANNYRDTFYERMDIYARGTGLPVLNTEFAWVTDYFTKARGAGGAVTGDPSVSRMLEKGRAALEKAIRHPQLVGFTWYRWVDKADFVPPISYGLVSVADEPNTVHLGILEGVNAQADALHQQP
ncbi:MAG: hypothetical protein H7Z41_09940 [Cytophagales bacterium]|nr:hypothetical protein [Armatimonadota bacterium]